MNTECYAFKAMENIHREIELKHFKHKLILGKFNILYLNINSIRNKLDELEINIQNIIKTNSQNFIHVIALTEVRVQEHLTKYFNIPYYTSFFQTRYDGHGGCALFIHDGINCSLVEKKSVHNIELLSVHLTALNSTLTVVYKQPSVDNELFLHTLESFIVNKRNQFLIGDFNVNLLNDSNITRRFTDMLISNGLFVLNKITVSDATRTAARVHSNERSTSSRSVIDLFITDNINFAYKLSQIKNTLSDHNEMILSLDNRTNNNFISIDDQILVQKINYEEYNNELHGFLTNTNIRTFDQLIKGLQSLKDKHTQTKNINRKINPDKPWITESILALINERKRYFMLHNKSPTNVFLRNKYNEICESIKRERYLARTNYNSSEINKNINNPKQMWQKLNEIIYNKKNVTKTVPILLTASGNETSDRSAIANTLNIFFRDVGKELHDRITITNLHIQNEVNNPHTMWLYNTEIEEVLSKISNLKTSKSTKEYISSYTCKKHALTLAPILTDLINDCYMRGNFPSELKHSRIIPIYKDGNRLSPNNYRPISILQYYQNFSNQYCVIE